MQIIIFSQKHAFSKVIPHYVDGTLNFYIHGMFILILEHPPYNTMREMVGGVLFYFSGVVVLFKKKTLPVILGLGLLGDSVLLKRIMNGKQLTMSVFDVPFPRWLIVQLNHSLKV